MRTKANQEFAFEVVDYFENVANRSKTETYRYFVRGKKKPRQTVCRILQRYCRTGRVDYSKNRGNKPTKLTAAMIEEYQRLVEIDPNISLREAAHRLNIASTTVQKMKVRLKKSMGEKESRSKESDYGIGNDEAVDDCHDDSMLGSYDGGSPVPANPNQDILNEPTRSSLVSLQFKTLHNTKEWIPIQPTTSKFSQCFICMDIVVDKKGKLDGTSTRNELTENLDATILLLKVLGVSPDTMTNLMKKSEGKCPREWLSSCSTCDGMIQEAVFLQKQIHTLEDKLRKAKAKITQKIKRSSGGKKGRRKLRGENGIIGMMVRKCVMTKANSHHQAKNSFLNGDLEAESKVKVKVKVERVEMESLGVSFDEADLGEGDDYYDDDAFGFANETGSEGKIKSKGETHENNTGETCEGIKNMPDTSEIFHRETGSFGKPSTELGVSGNAAESKSFYMPEVSMQHAAATDAPGPACNWISEGMPNMSTAEGDCSQTQNVAPMSHKPSEELVECDVCQKQMKSITLPMHKLREHKIVMEGFTKKECSVVGCPYVTLYDDQLEIHKTRHVSNKPRSFSCQYCGKCKVMDCCVFYFDCLAYPSQSYLKVHEELHSNESKPFQCDLCGKSFASRRYLYVHKRWHQGRLFPSARKKRVSKKKAC